MQCNQHKTIEYLCLLAKEKGIGRLLPATSFAYESRWQSAPKEPCYLQPIYQSTKVGSQYAQPPEGIALAFSQIVCVQEPVLALDACAVGQGLGMGVSVERGIP